ncbi:MAG: O-methyltransferase [Flavobacteriales bacterium]
MLISYLKYLLKAKSAHKIHSPFVFEWYYEHLLANKNYYALNEINSIRQTLSKSKDSIELSSLGAGIKPKRKSTVSKLLHRNSIPHKYGRILFELSNHIQANHILEIGTCIGISGLYLAMSRKNSNFITLEGHAPYAAFARSLFNDCGLEHAKVIEGNFDDTLSDALSQIPALDLVFFDGNHQYQATMSYFHACLEKKHEQSVFVFDDLYWSREMRNAWHDIKAYPEVSVTFDFFRLGVVFFRKGIVKQDFVLKY